MPTRPPRPRPRVTLRAPRGSDAAAFLAAARASHALHGHWVAAPATRAGFERYLRDAGGGVDNYRGYLVLRRDDGLPCGVFNLSQIVHGVFKSAYLGYYGFAHSAGQGYMREGLALLLDTAFGPLRLHRVEANVQPENHRSVAFLERAGFAREGYSRRYLKIAGRWRDHLRFAMLAEDWRAR